MRKIILGMDTSLDGVVESPEKWRFGYMSNDLQAYDMQKVNSVGELLLGRITYQMARGSGRLKSTMSLELLTR